ncbi:hypothetical protein ACFOLF_19695 [Paenibacillus sepulcri]|uniref:Flagellar protein FliT n=1 Tax=Paenibacillus sepulcri TaxID=359917 RepID=A0ABS7BV77_9BACL|nr:hypothetical protein [Paenibacillus sepulcri]
MDKLLEQLLAESRTLSQYDPSITYERYGELVDQRQTVTDLIAQRELTPSEKQYLQEILKYESMIWKQMQRLKSEAAEGINRLNIFKKQRVAYDQQGAYEGFLLDKRK